MSSITIELSPHVRQVLEEQAQRTGKPAEALTAELIEQGLQKPEAAPVKTAREVLAQAGRVGAVSEKLRRKTIPGVSLDSVRAAVTNAAGPALSQIIDEQRGTKS